MPIIHKIHSRENCKKLLRDHAIDHVNKDKMPFKQAWAASYSESARMGCGKMLPNGRFIFYSDLRWTPKRRR